MIAGGHLTCFLSLLFWLLCSSVPEVSAQEGVGFFESFSGDSYLNLAELTDAFSEEIAKRTEGRKIYLERGTIRDMNTGEIWNFSGYLQHELESSLSKQDFHLVHDIPDADFLLGASYRRKGDTVRIFFKCHGKEGASSQSWAYEIAEERLAKDAFQQTLEGKITKLVQDLRPQDTHGKVYVKPIRDAEQRVVSPFSRSFTARLRTEMVRLWHGIELIDEKPVLKRLAENKRGILVKAQTVKDLNSWEAACTDADMVLDGTYFVEGNAVTVTLDLKNLNGRLFGSAKSDIPKGLVHASLDNPQAAALSDLADTKLKSRAAGVRILTNLGGDFPIYTEGETIELFVQVEAPLFVYIYGIDTHGDVTRLYPADTRTPARLFEPGRLYPLSDENHAFQFVACPPFGMDLVKAFASASPIPLPELCSSQMVKSYEGTTRKIGVKRIESQKVLAMEKKIHPRDLVDYYRGIAHQKGARLYEDQVILETRAKGQGS